MQPTDRRAHGQALAAAVFVTVLWSSSWILIRTGLDDESLPPIVFAGLRYSAAAVVLLGVALAREPSRRAIVDLSRSDVWWLIILGIGFYALTQGAQFVAIDEQPAATTSLVLSFTPLQVAAAGAPTLRERPTPGQVVGAILVVVGAATYFSGDLGATRVGMIAALVALAANVTSSLLGRHVNRQRTLTPLVVTAVSMSIGAAILVTVGLATESMPSISATAILLVLWLAVVNTALAFTLWNRALRHLSALESAGINNLMLIQIAALAWVFLDEPPGPAGIIGIVAVTLGVFMTQRL